MFTKNSVGYSLCNFCYLYFLFFFVYLLLFNVCHSLQEIYCFSFFISFDIFFVALSKKISRKYSTNNSLYFLLCNLYFSRIIIPSHTLLINIHFQEAENTIIR